MPKFTEFEIKDFRGIASSNRNPQKNEAQICKNLDLREITGDLTSRRGYLTKYSAPVLTGYNLTSASWIRATNFVIDIDGTEKEITLLIGKAKLFDLSGVNDIYIPLFFIYPYYNGSSWIESWHWLNECYLTDVCAVSNNSVSVPQSGLPDSDDYFNDWTIFNLTHYLTSVDSQYHHIYNSTFILSNGIPFDSIKLDLVCSSSGTFHGFSTSDKVLIMRNFIPYPDLLEYYNVTANEISFHNVINDLRIGFGGKANRLPLMIGYRNKSFEMENDASGLLGSSVTQICEINKIILSPYNSITEDTKAGIVPSWGDQNAFHIFRYMSTGGDHVPDGRWFLKLTALIDGYEEFVLPAKFYEIDSGDTINDLGTLADSNYTDTSSQSLRLGFRIFWALFNKRITKLRLYISYDPETVAAEKPLVATAPYYLAKEWDLIGSAGSGINADYDINNYGYMFYNPGPATVFYYEFSGARWSELTKDGTSELAAKLNYPITDDYVRGWDQAVVVDRVCYVINPYINGERLNNYIFFSPFSSAGANQYDALQGGNYISLDSHDGNNLKGLGVFSNANLAAFKTNTLQKIRSTTAQVADLAFGYGLETFRSIINHGDKLTWCSQEDIFTTNGAIIQNISDNTIRTQFRSISSKENIIATKEERENAYRFYDNNGTQYLLTQRGWVSIDTYVDPVDYIIAKDGTVWFLGSTGIIFYQTGYKDKDTSNSDQAITIQWKSIPFDISLLGEGLTQGERFWVDGVFCKYSIPTDLSLLVYIDGVLHDTITLSASNTYYDTAIKYGAIARTVELEITGSILAKTIISSIGFRWRPVQIGNRV